MPKLCHFYLYNQKNKKDKNAALKTEKGSHKIVLSPNKLTAYNKLTVQLITRKERTDMYPDKRR